MLKIMNYFLFVSYVSVLTATAQSINPANTNYDFVTFAPGDNFVICAEDTPFYTLQSGVSFTWRASDGNFNARYSGDPAGKLRWDNTIQDQLCPTSKCCLMIFGGDGNLAQYNYDSDGNAYLYWETGTSNMGAALLIFQDDAPYVRIDNSEGGVLWSSTPVQPGPNHGGPGVGPPPSYSPCGDSGCVICERDGVCEGD